MDFSYSFSRTNSSSDFRSKEVLLSKLYLKPCQQKNNAFILLFDQRTLQPPVIRFAAVRAKLLLQLRGTSLSSIAYSSIIIFYDFKNYEQ